MESGRAKIVDYDGCDGNAKFFIEDGEGMPIVVSASADGVRRTSGFGYPLALPGNLLTQVAWNAYQLGQYQESIDLCRELNQRGEMLPQDYQCVHLASAGLAKPKSLLLSDTHDPQWCVDRNQIEKVNRYYPVEALWFELNDIQLCHEEKIQRVEECCHRIGENLWMVPAAHPTATILVADWLLSHTNREDLARKLVCCCLGWKYVYRRIDDLVSLAKLLGRLRAPKLFWTQIANLYYDFSTLDSMNQLRIKTQEQSGFNGLRVAAYWKNIDDKEGVLHRYCADNGFPERDSVTVLLFESFGLKNETFVKGNTFPGIPGYVAGSFEPWLSQEHFQMRHPWFCLLEPHERDFIRNGDTGFVACVTDDYSMACLQWWRAIESVLRRKLVEPLGKLIDANPSLLDDDLTHAHTLPPEREIEWEKLFVRELADPRRRKRMTLTHMLVLIESCIKDIRRKKVSPSLVRRHAVQHVSERLTEFRWIKGEPDDYADMRSAFSPNVLTELSIQTFRNEASHDQPMDYEHAIVGRLLAIRILDFMHYPRYCVASKLEELKAELRGSKETLKP